MSRESDYLRAEVSRAQKEGAKHVLVSVPEIHAMLARIAELEKRKADEPKSPFIFAGYADIEEVEASKAGGEFFTRISRGKRKKNTHPLFYCK